MTMFKCKHEGCSSPKHYATGYCHKHYQQFKKHKRTFEFTCADFNEVIDCGDYYELILLDRKLRENGRAKIDREDLEKVKKIGRWSLHSDGYVHNGSTCTMMHRLVLDAKEHEDVDHKETGTEFKLDNRKDNLRIATPTENSYNTEKSRVNTSGFKGVSYHKGKKKWQAQIKINGKQKHLGYFATPEEASKAYNKAAKELHGEFVHNSVVEIVTTVKRKRLILFTKGSSIKFRA